MKNTEGRFLFGGMGAWWQKEPAVGWFTWGYLDRVGVRFSQNGFVIVLRPHRVVISKESEAEVCDERRHPPAYLEVLHFKYPVSSPPSINTPE